MNKTIQVAIRMTAHEHNLLKKAAKYYGVSKAGVIRMALLEKYRRIEDEIHRRLPAGSPTPTR